MSAPRACRAAGWFGCRDASTEGLKSSKRSQRSPRERRVSSEVIRNTLSNGAERSRLTARHLARRSGELQAFPTDARTSVRSARGAPGRCASIPPKRSRRSRDYVERVQNELGARSKHVERPRGAPQPQREPPRTWSGSARSAPRRCALIGRESSRRSRAMRGHLSGELEALSRPPQACPKRGRSPFRTTLTCARNDGGSPEPRLTWFRRGRLAPALRAGIARRARRAPARRTGIARRAGCAPRRARERLGRGEVEALQSMLDITQERSKPAPTRGGHRASNQAQEGAGQAEKR